MNLNLGCDPEGRFGQDVEVLSFFEMLMFGWDSEWISCCLVEIPKMKIDTDLKEFVIWPKEVTLVYQAELNPQIPIAFGNVYSKKT